MNLAARLMGKATEHNILVDELTYMASRGRIRFECLPPVQLKGKEGLFPVYKPASIISRMSTGSRNPLDITTGAAVDGGEPIPTDVSSTSLPLGGSNVKDFGGAEAASFVGRSKEMASLYQAIEDKYRTSCILLFGEAGKRQSE